MAITGNEDTMTHKNFDEATQIVDHSSASSKESEKTENEVLTNTSEDSINKHKTAKTVGGIAVGGVLLGTSASVFMDLKGAPTTIIPEISDIQDENDLQGEGIILPEITVEALDLQRGSPVKEGMTFEEAFSAARNAMGSGSAFEWHGNVYATYTREEWTQMTDDQKSDFYDTLHIANPFSSTEKLEVRIEDAAMIAESTYSEVSGSKKDDAVTAQTIVQPEEDSYGDDIPVVNVGNAGENENDIQILGVSQDISTGYNVGHLSVDGEEVVVIDVDGDMVFDSMVADLNHDGDITPDEIIDIRQQSLSLNDLQGHSDIFNPLTSTGDVPDYLSEIIE